jgi:hypothetical protein
MRVTFDTEVDRYDTVLAVVHAAYAAEAADSVPQPDAVPAPEEPPADEGWTRERLTEFAGALAPDAAEAVRYIAAHAPAVSQDVTIAHLAAHTGIDGFNGQQMGGRMASVGFTCRRMRMKVPPLHLDKRTREYRMDPDVAAVLGELLGPPADHAQPASA